jgi:hypothetical protein
VITYIYNKAEANDLYPVFFMGNSHLTYFDNRLKGDKTLAKPISALKNKNLNLRLVNNPENTYTFYDLTTE